MEIRETKDRNDVGGGDLEQAKTVSLAERRELAKLLIDTLDVPQT